MTSGPKRILRTLGVIAAIVVALYLVANFTLRRMISPRPPHVVAATPPEPSYVPTGFWEAVESLELESAGRLAGSPDEQAFVGALGQVLDADLGGAIAELHELVATTGDDRLRSEALEGLGHLLIFDQRWNEFIVLADAHPELVDAETLDDSDLALSRILADRPAESWNFPPAPVVLRSDTIVSGTPRIPVVVNGRGERFAIDTGASMTVLADHVASRCGVEPIGDYVAEGATSTQHTVSWRPAVVDRLELGALSIENHPVAIIAGADLEFGVPGMTLIKLDGIIGWPVFRRARFEIDLAEGRTTIDRSETAPGGERNLFWLGYPVARLSSDEGRRLLFGVDTGARATSIRDALLDKISTGPVETAGGFAIGAGGREKVVRKRVRNVRLILGDHAMTFGNLGTSGGVKSAAIWLPDGQLGIDVAQNRRIVIDYRAGRLELHP